MTIMDDISIVYARREVISRAAWLVEHCDSGSHTRNCAESCEMFDLLRQAVERYRKATLGSV